MNIGEYIEIKAAHAGRKDLEWIGHVEADIELDAHNGSNWMRIMHPGGGSAYAVSYSPQKIVESFQGGEKPRILLLGHYHKFEVGYFREVWTVQGGCIQDQTPFLRKKKIQVHVGYSLIRLMKGRDGVITRFQAEWFPFFDRGFYKSKGKYVRW
jgi:hypothetical protein